MTPTHIILHTAAFKGDVDIQEIKRWHLLRGFKDVGYHYHIRKDGTLEKGRPENVKGAHCKAGGMNNVSIGICLAGHGDFEEWTEPQRFTLERLILDIIDRHNIITANIKGHNEYDNGKTCPGKLIKMNEVRDYFRARI